MEPVDRTAQTARLLSGGNPAPLAASLGALTSRHAADRGHVPFLTFYDDATGERTELSYATFDNWVAKTANLLTDELELERGDRVATMLGDHWTAPVVAFACWRAGCAVVALGAGEGAVGRDGDPTTPPPAAAFVREDLLEPGMDGTAERIVVVGTGLGARLSGGAPMSADTVAYAEEVLAFGDDYDDPDVGLDDDALVASSRSRPSAAARLDQGNLLAAAQALRAWGLSGGERVLCVSPLHSLEGLAFGCLGAFAAGGSIVVARHADPARLWRRVADERVTLVVLPASGLEQLPDGPPPDGLRGVLVPAGAPRDAVDAARRRLPVAVGHGLVEATCASTLSPLAPDEQTRSWVGAAAGRWVGAVTSHAAVAALDEAGDPVGEGRTGRIAVRGPVVMAGYEGRADLDEQVFASGWLVTTDRGNVAVGPDGAEHVFVTGPA